MTAAGAASFIHALTPITSRVRTDVSAVKDKQGRQAWTKEPINYARLAAHCNGGPARGVCPIKAGESTTMVALLDLDSHKGEVPWPEMIEVAKVVCFALELHGLEPIPWRSSGGRGIHIFILWDDPQDAYSVRHMLQGVLDQLGYANGAGGVLKKQIEVFPKQNEVPADGFGNQFVLPLAGLSAPIVPSLGWVVAAREYAPKVGWPSSAPVPVLERPPRPAAPQVAGTADTARLQAALAAIPNEGAAEQDYDAWRNILFAIHHATGGSDDGRSLAHSFSCRSSKYDPDFLDERVWPYIRDRDGGVTEQTIYAMAREHGFEEVTADDFVAPPPPPEPVFEVRETGEIVEVPPEPDTPPFPAVPRDKAGKVKWTVAVLQQFLIEPRWTRYRLGFDEFLGVQMIARPGEQSWRPVADTDIERLRIRFDEMQFLPISTEAMRSAVRLACEQNTFDSGRQWVESLKWDGVPRIENAMQNYFGCTDTPYGRAVGRYLFTALAGRMMDPGCKVDMVPVLVGAQGSRKSSACEALAPTPSAYTTVSLENLDDNVARRMRGRSVVELSELRGLFTKEAQHIKDWIARGTEDFVPKYQEYSIQYPRRCVLIGTSNPDEILADETGERRWLPIRTGAIDTDSLAADRDQLWAEGATGWAVDGVDWREAETLARAEHDAFKVVDAWTEVVDAWLDLDAMEGDQKPTRREVGVTVREVLVSALGVQVQNITRSHEMRIGKILRTLGLVKARVLRNGRQDVVWGLHTCHPWGAV